MLEINQINWESLFAQTEFLLRYYHIPANINQNAKTVYRHNRVAVHISIPVKGNKSAIAKLRQISNFKESHFAVEDHKQILHGAIIWTQILPEFPDIAHYGFVKDHNPESKAIYDYISELDFVNGDVFCFKSGGDGDNGEALMDLLDAYFANKFAEQEV